MQVTQLSRRGVITLAGAATGVAIIAIVTVRGLSSGHPAGANTQPTATPHATHQFLLDQVPASVVWHPGQRIELQWHPTTTGMASARPATLTCTVTLYGPYPTKARALDQESTVSGPPSSGTQTSGSVPPAVQADPLVLTDATDQPQASTLTLPTSLAPGFYILRSLETSASGNGNAVGTVSIVQIARS